jgi:hypothetical protein
VTAFLLAKAEWGTVPDWVTAFGTLAAFAVALRLLAKELGGIVKSCGSPVLHDHAAAS